jgi:hypothetical protein
MWGDTMSNMPSTTSELGESNPSLPVPCAVPDGWKLVPIEPTPGMIDAAGMGWIIRPSELRKRLKIYRAMIDAAPNNKMRVSE